MQIVIAPHPTEELILIRTQKELIKSLFEKGSLIYSHTPLWIPTPFESVPPGMFPIGINILLRDRYSTKKM